MLCNDGKEGEGEVAPRVSKAFAKACDAESLAGCAADDEVRSKSVWPVIVFCHVAQVGNVRPVMGKHGRRKFLDLGEGDRLPPERVPSDGRRFDAGTN
jgi:hypothetical protein